MNVPSAAAAAGRPTGGQRWLRWSRQNAVILVLLIGIAWALAGNFERGLWTPDEPREAEVGLEMLWSHGSAMPTLDGEPFLEKPPLFVWLVAASYALLDVSAAAARVPAALFSLGSLLVAYGLGRHVAGRWAGLAAAAVLATMVGFAEVAHSAVNDTLLVLLVASGHLVLLRARDRERVSRGAFWALAALAGLAFLTKAFIGPILMGAPFILALAADRDWRRLRRLAPPLIVAAGLGVVVLGVPWVLALAGTGGWESVRVCLVDNTLGRTLSGGPADFGHVQGVFYYLGAVPPDLMPWTLALPAVVVSGTLRRDRHKGRARFLTWMVVSATMLLSIPATKRGLYLVPLFPALAAVMGTWLSRVASTTGSRLARSTMFALVTTAVLATGAVAVFAGALATGWVPVARFAAVFAELTAARDPLADAALMIGALAMAGVSIVILGVWRRRRTVALAASTVALWVGTFVVLWGFVLPRLDPLKNMEAGAVRIAALVPADEPLAGFRLDESTRAAIPFHTGRLIENIPSVEKLAAELASGRLRHFVVMDDVDPQALAAIRPEVRLQACVRLSANRQLQLYRAIDHSPDQRLNFPPPSTTSNQTGTHYSGSGQRSDQPTS